MKVFDFYRDPKLRQKFVDDYSLPIKIMESPYFEYFMDTYYSDFDLEKKAQDFQKACDTLGDKLKTEWYRIKDSITESITSLPEFKELQESNFEVKNEFGLQKGNPYNQEDCKHICVSIDIRSANYTSLKFFDPKLVLESNSYQDLISRYTDLDYFKDSKIFRQLIFEPLAAKRQAQIQKGIIFTTSADVLSSREINPLKIKTVGNDELILLFDKNKYSLESIGEKMIKVEESFKHKDLLKVEIFDVVHLKDKYFYKRTRNGKVMLRNVPSQVYPQCFKKAKDLPIHPNDLLFIDGENGLAQYLKPLFEDYENA